jgi:hypothetical protein
MCDIGVPDARHGPPESGNRRILPCGERRSFRGRGDAESAGTVARRHGRELVTATGIAYHERPPQSVALRRSATDGPAIPAKDSAT